MKLRNYISIFGVLCGLSLSAQVTTDPPVYEDPTTVLKIIVDISQLDAGLDHTQGMLDAAAAGEDLYIWTWSPAEHPAGHPLENGVGTQPWKNSNDTLRMTKESANIYTYTMIPTEFYEVDAQTVFMEDIKFLVKPKDGGGYGDPDLKSEDLTLPIDPPNTTRNPAFLFPGAFQDDDLVMLYYDNNLEEEPGMQGLDPSDVWFFAEATLSDSSTVRISPSPFTVGNYPQLQMTSYGEGIYKTYMVPRDFFNVPSDKTITKMTMYVMRRMFTGAGSRITYDIIAELSCE